MGRYARSVSARSISGRGSRFHSFFRRTLPTSLALPLGVFICALASVAATNALAASAPTVVETTVSGVSGSSAVLQARINPNGAATTYHFEYGPADCAFGGCTSEPIPDGSVGSGEITTLSSNQVSGLQPGTTYHFRVVASNATGTTNGPDRTFTTFAQTPAQSCPNEQFRTGPSAALPDCRAYEMVSPIDKNGADIITGCDNLCNLTSYTQASSLGGAVTYSSYKSFGDAKGSFYSNQYLARRGPAGWSNHNLNPQHFGRLFAEFSPWWDTDIQFKGFTPDLSTAILADDSNPPITADAVAGAVNFYRRDNATDSYEAMTTYPFPAGFGGYPSYGLEGMTPDAGHVVFSAAPSLAPGAELDQVYDYSGGGLHLVSILPDGTQPVAAAVGFTDGLQQNDPDLGRSYNAPRAVSEDGSRIYWTAYDGRELGAARRLLVRLNPAQPQSAANAGGECTEPEKACTLSIAGVPEESSEVLQYQIASSDGSKVAYKKGLLASGPLFIYDLPARTSTEIAPQVRGAVLGASDDLSFIYFVSNADLAAGADAGQPNLYRYHDGNVTFIARLLVADTGQGSGPPALVDHYRVPERTAHVSANGQTLVFASQSEELSELVAGFDNTDAVSGEPDSEVYVYRAGPEDLICVSCNRSGERPRGRRRPNPGKARVPGTEEVWAAAWINTAENQFHSPNVLNEAGTRLYFNAYDRLVTQDNNNRQDVYQWEADGTGNCTNPEGCVNLITSGESSSDSEFIEATPDGRDVFFTTASSLLPQDPGLVDVYDARGGGGYPQPVGIANCEGEACQSPPEPPGRVAPGSAKYNGPGNLQTPARAHKKKHHRRHHKKKRNGAAKRHGHHRTHRNG